MTLLILLLLQIHKNFIGQPVADDSRRLIIWDTDNRGEGLKTFSYGSALKSTTMAPS